MKSNFYSINTSQEPSYFELLPKEMVLLVFSFLKPNELGNIASVSKLLNFLSNEGLLWKPFLKKYMLERSAKEDPKELYKEQLKNEIASNDLLKKLRNITGFTGKADSDMRPISVFFQQFNLDNSSDDEEDYALPAPKRS